MTKIIAISKGGDLMEMMDLGVRDILYTLMGGILILSLWAIPEITKLVRAVEEIDKKLQRIMNDCAK